MFVYKMASVVSSRMQKLSRRVYSFLSHHLSLKYTFEDLTNEQEMCSRMLDWKEMVFKVLEVTIGTLRYGDADVANENRKSNDT